MVHILPPAVESMPYTTNNAYNIYIYIYVHNIVRKVDWFV